MRCFLLTLLLVACGGGIQAAGDDPPADEDGDGYTVEDDCDDTDGAVHPGAAELCNGVDDDCDGATDDRDADLSGGSTFYEDADADGDGYGNPDEPFVACEAGSGTTDATDCDDVHADVYPGATESCANTWDDDCDGDTNDEGADGCSTFYADADADGFGGTDGSCRCLPDEDYPAFYAEDCDDGDAAVPPDTDEVCDDGVDNDCDGSASGCVWAGDTSLADSDARVVGEVAGANAGTGLLTPGDLDGDGRGDLVVLAPGTAAGKVAWFSGIDAGERATGEADGQLLTTEGVSLDSVVAGGDLDGDGVFDLVVGSVEAAEGAGAVWLWSAPGGSLQTLDDLALRLVGDGGANAGLPSTPGDLDGDGWADLAVSAQWDEEVYVLAGPVTAGGNLSDLGRRIVGATGGADALAGVGDLDGDGLVDLAVGASAAGGDGQVWVLLGPCTAVGSLGSADAAITGTEAEGAFGGSLAGGFDLDGDGYGDFAVGAPDVDLDGRSKGQAYLFRGPLSGDAGAADAAFAILDGEYTDDHAGAAISGGGDVDGDGTPDLAVGAPGNDQVAGAAGLTYILYGPVTAGSQELKWAGAFFEARQSREASGTALSIAADLDADGLDDVVIGAPGYDGDESDQGSVEVFFSRGL